ncbi:hypothetical protein KCU64_g3758, partial [Aureobasidium melanogenum]
LSFDEPEAVLHPQETALVKWGTHPFAGSWLIDTLFAYFENLADVQMLGMLSCIFAQSLSPDDQRPTYEHLPQSMSCAAQLFDYFPNKETAFGFYEPIISISDLSNKHRRSGAGLTESAQDIRDQVASEPVTPFYTDNTPPMPLSRADTHRSSAAPSLSTSPEHHPRPFQLASSPPVRNKTSGEELSSSTPSQTGVNWNKSKPFTRSDSTIRRSFISQGFGDDYDGSTTEDDESLPPQSRVKISLKNQDMFDDEGCPNVAFLDPNQSIKFAVYRAVYANMLGAWGLQMQQNEVDKLDGLLSNILTRTESRDRGSQSTLTLGEVEADQETLDGLGPQVIRCCMSCGEVDGPERRGAGCVKCGGRSHLLSCTICYQPIAGLYKLPPKRSTQPSQNSLPKTIDNAVKDQAKRLKKAFAAAVTRRLDRLNVVRQKETEMRIDKAVKKAVLDARVEEMEFAIELESEFCDKVESDDADPKNRLFSLDEYFHMRMDEWKNELAELGEVQEEKV